MDIGLLLVACWIRVSSNRVPLVLNSNPYRSLPCRATEHRIHRGCNMYAVWTMVQLLRKKIHCMIAPIMPRRSPSDPRLRITLTINS